MSPPSTSSHAPTITSVGQAVKTNVVTRIAIEGKAKQGEEGASVKMYLKVSYSETVNSRPSEYDNLDSLLFPWTPSHQDQPLRFSQVRDMIISSWLISFIAIEENVKILTSQVHPLDSNSVPYNFSSSTSPLLHDAARALNLPPRLPTTFDATYHLSPSPILTSIASTNCSTESGSVAIPPVDPYFTGQILVSGYNIAYVLPKYFPSREIGQHESEFSHSLHNKRRPSVGDRNYAHFMAAVDMWVPFVTRPPRFPYHVRTSKRAVESNHRLMHDYVQLSIPTPRCLHNNIRLRIFPPYNTPASFASLSSLEDDSNSWDLTSDPHVTRTTSNRHARSVSYNHFADDESSDSSTSGFPNGFGIQGTFPSTDRLRIRWAKPMKSLEGAAGNRNLRRRVGVKDVRSEMLCVVRGKRQSSNNGLAGIVIDIEYKATCKGIWFPGVAILLGLDVCLVAKNADVGWLTDSPIEWNVVGGVGYTGFGITGTEQVTDLPLSKASSFDSQSPEDNSLPLPNGGPKEKFSTQSLLRAPLPSNNAAECFFEDPNDATTSHLGTISSVSSLSQFATAAPPLAPLTLHINMNDILPPNKTPFTFSIHGTILVTPKSIISRVNDNDGRSSPQDYSETTEPISLPHFTVLAADAETAKIEVKNAIEGTNATVEIYSPSGDIAKDPQTRRTVIQKGGSARCTEGGGRIAIRTIRNRVPFVQPHTPASSPISRVSQSITQPLRPLRQVRQHHNPLLIHSVKVTVTPFVSRRSLIPDVYAVKIHLSIPANNETDWLEFGLPRVDLGSCLPRVQIAAASVAGLSVQHVITNTEKQPLNNESLPGAVLEKMEGTEWVSWVKIQAGPSSGDKAVIDYIVTVEPTRSVWSLNWNKGRQWDLLLPTFTLPIERLHVKLKSVEGELCCNFMAIEVLN